MLRMHLRCEIFRNEVFDVLNKVVVDQDLNSYLSDIGCYEHNHLISEVRYAENLRN